MGKEDVMEGSQFLHLVVAFVLGFVVTMAAYIAFKVLNR